MDKNVSKIVTSELVVRTNNVRFRQEYGEVGNALNIREDGTQTIFTTLFGIDKVIYLTVNGVNLIEGVHYEIASEFTISISKDGNSAIKKQPGITTNILVGYNYTSKLSLLVNVPTDPPEVNNFYLNKSAGTATILTFNFSITPFDGQNIFWSIIKDGSSVPLYSGTALDTINGAVPDGAGGIIDLTHEITQAEYDDRTGETIPFTLVVVYDLTNDGTELDEKILETATYHLVEDIIITAEVISTPETVIAEGGNSITVDYTIDINGSGDPFVWRLMRRRAGQPDVQLSSGTESTLVGTYIDAITTIAGDSYTNNYEMDIKLLSDIEYTLVAADATIINVASDDEIGNAGYVDTSVVNYEASPGNWIKIGDLNTPQDAVEYNNRVSRSSFTKNIDKTYLYNNQFLEAPVYTDGGNIEQVHFVFEAPDSWGPIDFYQALGSVPIEDFNAISLGNGYTAYLYVKGASSVLNPTDFYLKPNV